MVDADAEASGENPICGDRLQLWLRVREGRVEEMRWRADGCAPVIAAASVTSELVSGMELDAVHTLDAGRIAGALGGLPARKEHAAALVALVLRRAAASCG